MQTDSRPRQQAQQAEEGFVKARSPRRPATVQSLEVVRAFVVPVKLVMGPVFRFELKNNEVCVCIVRHTHRLLL